MCLYDVCSAFFLVSRTRSRYPFAHHIHFLLRIGYRTCFPLHSQSTYTEEFQLSCIAGRLISYMTHNRMSNNPQRHTIQFTSRVYLCEMRQTDKKTMPNINGKIQNEAEECQPHIAHSKRCIKNSEYSIFIWKADDFSAVLYTDYR